MKSLNQIAFVLLLSLVSVVAKAELTIEITQGIDNPTPIAVSPFAWTGNDVLSEDVSAIVNADLARSGMFDLMNKGDMLSQPSLRKNVYYRDWRALGREYLLIGHMVPAKEGTAVTELEVGNLQLGTDAIDLDPVLAPVELESLSGSKLERYIGMLGSLQLRVLLCLAPLPGECRHPVIGAGIAQPHQIFVEPLHSTPLLPVAAGFAEQPVG